MQTGQSNLTFNQQSGDTITDDIMNITQQNFPGEDDDPNAEDDIEYDAEDDVVPGEEATDAELDGDDEMADDADMDDDDFDAPEGTEVVEPTTLDENDLDVDDEEDDEEDNDEEL